MILESDPEIEVVGEAADGADAVDAVRSHRPDVVLMDVRMPRLDGVAATAAVRALDHPPAVVVLTTFDTDDCVFRALEPARPASCSRIPHRRSYQRPWRRAPRRCHARALVAGGWSPARRRTMAAAAEAVGDWTA